MTATFLQLQGVIKLLLCSSCHLIIALVAVAQKHAFIKDNWVIYYLSVLQNSRKAVLQDKTSSGINGINRRIPCL
jgi:hypothetical protein